MAYYYLTGAEAMAYLYILAWREMPHRFSPRRRGGRMAGDTNCDCDRCTVAMHRGRLRPMYRGDAPEASPASSRGGHHTSPVLGGGGG